MQRFELYRRWLLVMGGALVVFGVVMSTTSATPVFEPFNRLIDPAFWPARPPDPGAVGFRAWAYGVWGATIAGWGVAIALLAHTPFARRERWAWWAVAAGTCLWFVLDTAVSLAHGVTFNVAFNLALLVIVGIPLVATRELAGRPIAHGANRGH
jgi:hypothetical protein